MVAFVLMGLERSVAQTDYPRAWGVGHDFRSDRAYNRKQTAYGSLPIKFGKCGGTISFDRPGTADRRADGEQMPPSVPL